MTSVPASRVARLAVHRLDTKDELAALLADTQGETDTPEHALAELHPRSAFTFDGHCWVDRTRVAFLVDYEYAFESGGRPWPNWRERLLCPLCGLNNRQRAMVHVATEVLGLDANATIYLTEQVSAVHRCFAARFPHMIGSEYLGPDSRPGSVDPRGVRHEDLTRLTLADASVNAVLTFDVLEHVPDYCRALAECFRVLAPGGALLLTAPFLPDSDATRVRASVGADSTTVHHLPPQYHGDPVHPDRGVLCYQEFGWDLLDRMRAAGFVEAAAIALRSPEYGYLGGWQLAFVAWKSTDEPDAPAPAFDREALLHAPQVGEYAWHAFTVDETVSRTSLEHLSEIDRALSAHGLDKRGARLLEVGAYRHYTGHLAAERWGMDVTLTDIAASSLREGHEAALATGLQARPHLVAADFHDLPLGDGQFDAVFVASSVHHTRAPERVLREMWRVLRPGGLLLLENEPCERLACFYRFCSNRPESFTPFERYLDDKGLLRTISSPFPGSRAEEVFGMVENNRIPVGLFLDELTAEGRILEWQLQIDSQVGAFETSLLAIKGTGHALTRDVYELLHAAIEPARERVGETDRLLGFSLPGEAEIEALAERIGRALEALPPSGPDRQMALATLFGAALKAVARKAGPVDARTAIGPRFRRAMRQVDGVWEEAEAHRGIAGFLGVPRWPDVYRCENAGALGAFVPAEEWRIEREAHGVNSLLNLGADASLRVDTHEEGVLLLRLYAVVENGVAFTLRTFADDRLLDCQVMPLTESRLVRAWVPADIARVRIELRTLDGAPLVREGAIRVGVAQLLPVGPRRQFDTVGLSTPDTTP